MLRKVLLISSGHAAASMMRLIPFEDYGIAATFAVAMAVVEMASQLGLQQMIVQAREGDDPKFQAALQGFQVLRGVIAGVTLFVFADAVATFLKIPDVAWAYQVMALVPVLNALQHFDIHRLNRERRFLPMVMTSAVPALVSLLAIWPLAVWMNDYRVMLYALIVQAVVAVATSHLMAERPYRMSLDRAIIGQALSFGWPLLVNGVLLFATFQGDKIIVARELGMAPLAVFAMGVTLTLTPTLVMAKSAQNLFLPDMSRAAKIRDTAPAEFANLSHAMIQAAIVNGSLVVVAILLFGPWLISTVLGTKFASLLPILVLFGVQQGLRVLKTGPNVIALACGNTTNAMLSNLIRVLSLPVAWWAVAHNNGGLVTLLVIAICTEVLGFLVAVTQVKWRFTMTVRRSLPALGIGAAIVGAAAATTYTSAPMIARAAYWACPLLLALLCVAVPDLRRFIFAKRS